MLKRTRPQSRLSALSSPERSTCVATKENLPSPPSTPKRAKSTRSSRSVPSSVCIIDAQLESIPQHDGSIYVKSSDAKHSNLYQQGKAIFRRTAVPSRLIGRAKERESMTTFWEHHVLGNHPGCLYVSGAPGTGKTAMLMQIMRQYRADIDALTTHQIRTTMINCMTVKEPKAIYLKLVEELKGPRTAIQADVAAQAQLLLQNKNQSVLNVVILDEIDHLVSRDQDVLYKLFEWASTPSSRLVLIGIANALDLTDRVLPRLRAKNCEPQLIHFNPYQISEIMDIIKDRLYSLACQDAPPLCPPSPQEPTKPVRTLPLMQPAAVELCARKVAATMGDLRTAFDVCRQAIELAETEQKRKPLSSSVLSEQGRNGCVAPLTPSPESLPKATIAHVARVLQTVLSSPTAQKLNQLNLQQKMVISVLMVMMKRSKKDPITVAKLREQYSTLCSASSSHISPVSRSELNDLLSVLEASSVIALGSGKDDHVRRIHVNVQESEIMDMVRQVKVLDIWVQEILETRS